MSSFLDCDGFMKKSPVVLCTVVSCVPQGLSLLEVSPVCALLLCAGRYNLQASRLQSLSLPVVGNVWFLA